MKVLKLTVRRLEQPCGLHLCLRHALRLGRWAGFFPVQGLGQTNAHGTRFKLKSLYSCYYVTTIIGQVLMSFFTILWCYETEASLNNISNIIFYVTSLISAILLSKLAKQWPKLMRKAAETEQGLTEVKLDNRALVKSNVIAYVTMALAMVEHIFCTYFNVKFVMICFHEVGITTNVMENYVVHRMPYIFNYVPYNMVWALLFEFLCLQSTFLWSFTDVLIICFSIYITSYFNNLNRVIAFNAKKDKDHISWAKLREHYSNLVKLVKEIDSQVSSIILLSFFTDLYFICLQLFNSLHRTRISFKNCDEIQIKQALSSPAYLLYYLYSFLFLVFRALMLSLFAANVHYTAMEPIFSVNDVPSSTYDNEVRRFQLQLHQSKIALSGKFFHITRNMVLKMVGTIITYELVLLQYSIPPNSYNNISSTITVINDVTKAYGQI